MNKIKLEIGKQNIHCSLSTKQTIVKESYRTFLIILIVWVIGAILFCGHLADAKSNGKKLAKVRCMKDKYGNNNCTCPEDPITERYVDTEAEHCEFYYLCHLGVAIKMQCAPYWAFHPAVRECLPRSRIPKNVCKPLVDCPVRPNRYVEDPTDCTKYYLCYYGKHFHWTCPEATYFEPEQEKCVNDRGQAEACVTVAKRNFFKKVGYEKPPPKTSVALTEAKVYLKQKGGIKKKG